MAVSPQASFSQRMTCPPRAAVRQRSIALITLSWPNLELAEAQVTAIGLTPSGPGVAEDIRALQAHAAPALCRRPLRWQRQPIEGAEHRAEHVGGDVGIAGCRVQLGMAQQHLNHPHVDIVLQQMRGERMAQCMRCPPAAEPRGLCRHRADAVELAHRYWPQRVLTRKQPASRPALQPPCAEQREKLRRQHGMPIPRFREGRLLRPLPSSTRISIRLESMSPTRSMATSPPRRPAPHGSGLRPARGQAPAILSAVLYLRTGPGPGAASISRATCSRARTRGSFRG